MCANLRQRKQPRDGVQPRPDATTLVASINRRLDDERKDDHPYEEEGVSEPSTLVTSEQV